MKWLSRKLKDQRGQGLVEYALILALIAVVVIGILTTMGTSVQGKFSQISTKLT